MKVSHSNDLRFPAYSTRYARTKSNHQVRVVTYIENLCVRIEQRANKYDGQIPSERNTACTSCDRTLMIPIEQV